MKMDFKGEKFSASFTFLFAEIIFLVISQNMIIAKGLFYTLGLSLPFTWFLNSSEKMITCTGALITLPLMIYSIYRLVVSLNYNRKNCRQAYILELSTIGIFIFLALTTIIIAMCSPTPVEGELIDNEVNGLLAFGLF